MRQEITNGLVAQDCDPLTANFQEDELFCALVPFLSFFYIREDGIHIHGPLRSRSGKDIGLAAPHFTIDPVLRSSLGAVGPQIVVNCSLRRRAIAQTTPVAISRNWDGISILGSAIDVMVLLEADVSFGAYVQPKQAEKGAERYLQYQTSLKAVLPLSALPCPTAVVLYASPLHAK